jgi:hypothetical protein
VVEGAPRATLFNNSGKYAFHIAEHLARRNSHRLETDRPKVFISRCIALRSVATIMRLAVNLKRETGLQASEVDHERVLRTLLAEFEAAWALAQLLP